MSPGKDDDAASGIFTYDGSFASSAQNSHVTSATHDGSISFAAKVAAENEKVAQEFDLPLGVYGFRGPRLADEEEAVSTSGSGAMDELASTFSGVYEMDDSSFVRNVSADAIFEAQERADSKEKDRTSSPPGSKGEDTRGTMGLIGDYALPSNKGSQGGSQESNGSPQGGIMDAVMRTMVRLGLAWDGSRPSPPESVEKTGTPTGSHEEEASVGASVSMLSFDGPEANTTTSASKAPLFKVRAVLQNYPARSTTVEPTQVKPPLLNPARLITVCSCVVLISVALAIGGYIAISRRGESESERASPIGSGDDDEFLDALTPSTVGNPAVTTLAPPTESPCGEDSLSALFDINGDAYDCIWFSERSSPYRNVMCDTRPDIADACRETCTGKCASTQATQGNPNIATSSTSSTSGTQQQAAVVTTASPVTTTPTSASTGQPSGGPTRAPVSAPTSLPSLAPVAQPTVPAPPTTAPIAPPTRAPVSAPTRAPVSAPTSAPIAAPTSAPIAPPTRAPVTAPTRPPTRAPIAAPTSAPFGAGDACPPDSPGFIPGSTTSCEEFGMFHPDFRAQRCRTGWPVFTFCYATCGNCIAT